MTSAGHGQAEDGKEAAWLARQTAQAAAFDRICDRYDEAFPHKEGQLACGEWLLARLRPGARVLDVGCGTGIPTARQLAGGGCEVTGIDISPVMLSRARAHVPAGGFRELDVMDLARLPGGYDAVVAFFSLLNLPRAVMPDALRLIYDALVPGGLFCLAMVEADVDDTPITFLGSRLLVTGYVRDELSALLRAAGFAVVAENALSYAPPTTGAGPEIQLFANCQRLE
jgi:SAM-dependent methyltransferase